MTVIKNIIYRSFFTAFFLFVFLPAARLEAIAPPLKDYKTIPRSLMSDNLNAGGYGLMISPEKKSAGPSKAIGGGIGNNLTDYIKTNKNINVIVVAVEFNDVKMSGAGLANINSMLAEMSRYYSLESAGKINIISTMSPRVYKLNAAMSFYGDSDDAETLARHAVEAADADIDFSKYQCLMVAHSGYGDETNPSNNSTGDIWSRYWYSYGYNSITTGDGVKIEGATIVPEFEYENVSPLGVICHEFGHQLGLPDLYDTSYATEGGIGRWSLMATGAYNGSPRGSMPAMLDPWCRGRLGWIEYEIIQENRESFSFEFNKVYKIATAADTLSDYFLLEKRARIPGTYDEGLPGEGLLIFHVNASAGRESSLNPNNYDPGLIRLICANAKNHLTVTPRSKIRGLETDPYPTESNRDFYAYSNPPAHTWDGRNADFSLRAITKTASGAALIITADIHRGTLQPETFKTGSFLTPGVNKNIVILIKPVYEITDIPAAYITDQASINEPLNLKGPLTAARPIYFASITTAYKPSRLKLTLTFNKKGETQKQNEEYIFYY